MDTGISLSKGEVTDSQLGSDGELGFGKSIKGRGD